MVDEQNCMCNYVYVYVYLYGFNILRWSMEITTCALMFIFSFVFTASIFFAHPTGTWVDRIFSQVHAWRRTFCADMVHCNELSEMQLIHAWRRSLCAF